MSWNRRLGLPAAKPQPAAQHEDDFEAERQYRVSRSAKNWTWAFGVGATLLVAIMGWAFNISASSQTREESDKKYATKESVDLLREDVKAVKETSVRIENKMDTMLLRTPPRHYREAAP